MIENMKRFQLKLYTQENLIQSRVTVMEYERFYGYGGNYDGKNYCTVCHMIVWMIKEVFEGCYNAMDEQKQ